MNRTARPAPSAFDVRARARLEFVPAVPSLMDVNILFAYITHKKTNVLREGPTNRGRPPLLLAGEVNPAGTVWGLIFERRWRGRVARQRPPAEARGIAEKRGVDGDVLGRAVEGDLISEENLHEVAGALIERALIEHIGLPVVVEPADHDDEFDTGEARIGIELPVVGDERTCLRWIRYGFSEFHHE